MPTPIQILTDPISLVILAMYGLLMAWEALLPARPLPTVRFWKLRGLASFAVYFYLSSYLPLLTDPFLSRFRLFDLSGMNVIAASAVAVVFYEFGLYAWHWAMHRYDLLWRAFHQMHHSAERLDTYGAFFFSINDMIGFTFLGSICFALLLGLPPQAVTVFLLTTTFFAVFQHANVRTPRWLGYIVQRPESHTVHHGKGLHKYNYSDLPVFDILFGTFRNPAGYEHETGFYQGASARIWEMLTFRDISKAEHETN